MKSHFSIYSLLILLFACSPTEKETAINTAETIIKTTPQDSIYTAYSKLENEYENFESPKAINRLAMLENAYFQAYESGGISRYHGTVWQEEAKQNMLDSLHSRFDEYAAELGERGDSLHCTIYAVEGLKAGFGAGFEQLDKQHKRIWRQREYAGWSLGYLLVKHWGWKAYLIMDRHAQEFEHCQKAYRRNKSYPVWKQPDIPLEALYIRGEDDVAIDSLLKANEFGWGFSHQGIHTWVTRFDELKECNWLGAPSKSYAVSNKPLFITTPFLKYFDYGSHVVVFPPKK